MAEPTDVQHLVKQLMAGASSEDNKALLDALMSAAGSMRARTGRPNHLDLLEVMQP